MPLPVHIAVGWVDSDDGDEALYIANAFEHAWLNDANFHN